MFTIAVVNQKGGSGKARWLSVLPLLLISMTKASPFWI
jgi:hypothetical protein